MIRAKEHDAVNKAIENDASGTIQSLVSGQSSHQDYWLEEAMETWIAKDPTKAEEWYQSNWKSLPANKSQYVAAAYATEALKQGDATTARQWAAHIQDPKTKQRIQDGIDKAAAKAKN